MTTNETLRSARIVCELDPSVRADERVRDALAACEERGAALYVVWVFQAPAAGGGIGTFGMPTVLGAAVEAARERGIAVTSAVRFGNREVVLRREPAPARTSADHTTPLAA
jgi:hypothetical protein